MDYHNKVHGVNFKPGVNVVTGRSSTGKSALIEIFDFCFGSSDFTVPEGIITQHADLYFTIISVRDLTLVLARREDARKAFLKVEVDSEIIDNVEKFNRDYFSDAYFSTLDHFKKELASYFGLDITDVDENLEERVYRGGQKQSRPSIRSFTSFLLQHQNLIANKHAIFYRFDQKEKRDQAIDHFKIFTGFVDQDYFLKTQSLNELRAQQRLLEQRIPRAAALKEQAKLRLQDAINAYSAATGIQLNLGAIDELLEKPQVAIDALEMSEVQLVAASDQHMKIREHLEKNRAKLTGELRKRELKRSAVRSSISYADRYYSNVQSVLLPDRADLVESECPFCHSLGSPITKEANLLEGAITWLNGELEKSPKMLSSFAEEEAKLTRSIDSIKEEISHISRQFETLDRQIESLNKGKSQHEIALKEKLRIEGILGELLEKPDEKLADELSDIKSKITQLTRLISSTYDLDRKLRSAEDRIRVLMSEISEGFEFEKTYDPVCLQFSLTTFDLWHQSPTKEVFLRSMGSGANWLSCHLTLFLALHRYFCELGDSCLIPSFMFFDQPSQVYFPSVVDQSSEFDPQKLGELTHKSTVRIDEDIVAVTNLYSQLVAYCKTTLEETGIEPQIIVTDHADHLRIAGDRDFEELVSGRRWRKQTEGFIQLDSEPPEPSPSAPSNS
ncbi:DUF3732 domain-containing protein [Haloferula sp. BvORR071]|uniref:DUF3732 domain-containing protein n=1 Tax=Haloferula sp. BvORR071 TaxID=1396141 RepID=UPI000AC6BD63|nr:DUF3732 domain-containing protein [Haloferula sp. BvORR071]